MPSDNNRNLIIFAVLSFVVIFGWQFFVTGPQLEKAQREAELRAGQTQTQRVTDTGVVAPTQTTTGAAAPAPSGIAAYSDRAQALAASARVAIDSPALKGSINLTGARIDDLELKEYRETVDPNSPIITLLSPSGAPGGYYIEQGFVTASGTTEGMPGADAVWTLEGPNQTLTKDTPACQAASVARRAAA